jgi:multicomponent Na+:H+ antiporter subunit E
MTPPENTRKSSSTADTPSRVSPTEDRGRFWQQLPLLLGLVLLWTVLWGQATWLSVLTGFIIAIVVTRVFYLPPADISGRLNVWYALVFLAHFLLDVAIASFTVAFQALNPQPVPLSSIIGIQLRTRSDFVMTSDAIAMSLVPGSLVVEVDRERAILYFHTFDTQDAADVEAMRKKVLVVETRLVRAIGSKSDLARIQESEATP